MVDHTKYLLEICEKVDRDIASPTCKKLREHLAKCPDCAAYYDSLKKTIFLYRNYDVKLKGSHVEEILTKLELEGPLEIKLPSLQSLRKKHPR